ncbi:MAG: hypothetical protein CMO55_01255 [Verrucomicrobiales bacterium]|nr:hypothetical protein [Verrucomicrobiales bacterium]
MGKAIVGILLGAVFAFAWSFVSWSILPYHDATLKQFSNEAAVTEAIKSGADEQGIYLIPGDTTMAPDERMELSKKGPAVFVSVRPGPNEDRSMNSLILRGFLSTLVCSLLMGIMLSAAAPRLNYIGRVFFVTLGGLFAGLAAAYPNNIWWEFSTGFTGLAILDLVVGWFFAGLVMAGIINGK